jgi:hypothetical protein
MLFNAFGLRMLFNTVEKALDLWALWCNMCVSVQCFRCLCYIPSSEKLIYRENQPIYGQIAKKKSSA